MPEDAPKPSLGKLLKVYINRKERDEGERNLCRWREWNLGNLQPKSFNYLPNYPTLTLQA